MIATSSKASVSAQNNAPLTREEQLKKLKRSKDNQQTSLFGDDEEPPAQGSFVLGSGLDAMQPYLEKFLSHRSFRLQNRRPNSSPSRRTTF